MEWQAERDAVRLVGEGDKVLAEVTFPEAESGIAQIDHTFVDESLRGQGIAGQLLVRATAVISMSGLRARPTCSYAVSWFERHPDKAHLLA